MPISATCSTRWCYPAEALLAELTHAEPEEDGSLHPALSPDDYHKDNVSGGAAYAVALPQASFDFVLPNGPRHALFLDYLREVVLGRGGFGALESDTDRGVPVAELTAGPLPF